MNAMQKFSAKGAKIVAGFASRFAVSYGVVWLVKYGVLSAAWASDQKHIIIMTGIAFGAVYELEEMAWQKWGWDIPGILEKIGVPLMQATPTDMLVVPSTPPQAQPSAAPVEPKPVDIPKAS